MADGHQGYSLLCSCFMVAGAFIGVFMQRASNQRIVAVSLMLLVGMPKRMDGRFTCLNLFSIIPVTVLYIVMAYVVFCPGQEVDLSFVDFENCLFLYCWCKWELTGWEINACTTASWRLKVSSLIMNIAFRLPQFISKMTLGCVSFRELSQKLER